MDRFHEFLEQLIELLTTDLARGLGILALISCILMFLFGQSGGVFKYVLGAFFAGIALANAPDIFDTLAGTR